MTNGIRMFKVNMTPAEHTAYTIWKEERDRREREKGAWYLSPEGRVEMRRCFDDPDDLVPVYLNEIERLEQLLENHASAA